MQWITTTQVLDDLKTSKDSLAWKSFRDQFYPAIYNFARRLGLADHYAEDAAQETMLAFLKAYRKGLYNRGKGRLSNWVFGVARNVINNQKRRIPKERLISDNNATRSWWDLQEDDKAVKHTWDTEWKKIVLERCMLKVRKQVAPNVFEAFTLYALTGKPVDMVAEKLNMTTNAVYIAKSRVLNKLRLLKKDFE